MFGKLINWGGKINKMILKVVLGFFFYSVILRSVTSAVLTLQALHLKTIIIRTLKVKEETS